jgi:steroid delta-isomerase-like uncharacterized protein
MMKPMDQQEMIRLARENVEAWTKGDWGRLRAPFAPDLVYNELGTQRRMQGVEKLVEDYQSWKRAMPDGSGRVTNAFASGDQVLLEVIWSGTQNGPMEGPGGSIPPSGKSFSEPAAQVMVFRGDKIVEFRHYFDMMTMLQQLGVMPQMAQAEMEEEIPAGM